MSLSTLLNGNEGLTKSEGIEASSHPCNVTLLWNSVVHKGSSSCQSLYHQGVQEVDSRKEPVKEQLGSSGNRFNQKKNSLFPNASSLCDSESGLALVDHKI